ncbi:metal ABC transporter solute-binding protein, Zn/Mn family [Paenibacillus turpanensis]|uniref:metal ABC transporter solute-binding protein, Zn/Mn family n=1 Tax=Paenibacillus turpanensis TaxID=2689078 RepID=UPI001409727B|nr:zinc ABC transporter substrate-binding protein [Paenibacillus turpanensis]
MGKMKRVLITIFTLIIAIAAAGCAQQTQAPNQASEQNPAESGNTKKLAITTTIGMVTDIVEQVGGEHVEVTGLMKAGVDPHLYKASQGDIKKLDEADLIFYNGLFLEGKMQEILEKISKEKPVVAVSKGVDKSVLLAGDASLGEEFDPHIWFDVTLWMKAVEVVRDTLVEQDAARADDYKKNAETYLKKLEELHTYAKEQLASIPKSQRVLVTAHDAFGYFGRAYEVDVKGLQGLSTASEYGSKDVSELRDFLVDNKIKAVFVESSVPKRSIEAVVQGAKEKGHEVSIGGELFSDAMGEPGTEEGTYIGMVRHNVDTIVKALK